MFHFIEQASKDGIAIYDATDRRSAHPVQAFAQIFVLFPYMTTLPHSLLLVSSPRLESVRRKLGWPEKGIDGYIKEQGIDTTSSRARGVLSEFGWRKAESQSYGEDEDE